MLNKKIISFLVFCCLGIAAFSQASNGGSVVIVQDPRIDSLVNMHIELNEKLLLNTDNYSIEGFRIQIFEESGNKSSTRAREVMAEFAAKYPDISTYLTWKAPNFKVRVGDFLTRLDAQGFLNKIKKDYPIAWVIKDKIKYPINN